MFKDYFVLLLLGHVLGDFYFQTEEMARKKEEHIKWVLGHSLVYFIVMTACVLPVCSVNMLLLAVMASVLHGLIDVIKYSYVNKKQTRASAVFVADQLLHISALVILSYIWTCSMPELKLLPFITEFFNTAQLRERMVCKLFLSVLLIHKPANILIQKLIGSYKPAADQDVSEKDNNMGRMIGTVERIVMLMLLIINQYSAIGLVLTAKSIARYDRISKNEKFAEYYLLGTLLSVGIVIGCGVFLKMS